MGTPTGTLGTFGNFGRKNQIFSLQGRNQYLTWCRCLCLSLYFCEISGEMFNKAPGWHHVTLWSFDKKVYKYSIYIYICICMCVLYLYIYIFRKKLGPISIYISKFATINVHKYEGPSKHQHEFHLFVRSLRKSWIPPSCSFLGNPTPKNLQVRGSHLVQTV